MADEKNTPQPAEAVPEGPSPEETYGLQSRFGEDVAWEKAAAGEAAVTVARERLLDVCRFLKEEHGFDFPLLVSGVDRGDRLESVVHLGQAGSARILILKSTLPYDDPRVPSVTSIWAGAEWHERESYDMMGIVYEGHPDLRRILLPEDWDEYPHPLRKEFKLDSAGGKFTIVE